jgi:hypothetical protein
VFALHDARYRTSSVTPEDDWRYGSPLHPRVCWASWQCLTVPGQTAQTPATFTLHRHDLQTAGLNGQYPVHGHDLRHGQCADTVSYTDDCNRPQSWPMCFSLLFWQTSTSLVCRARILIGDISDELRAFATWCSRECTVAAPYDLIFQRVIRVASRGTRLVEI